MTRRRDYTPLLGGARNGTNSLSAGLLGLICGVALGGLLVFSFLSWMPRRKPLEPSGEADNVDFFLPHEAHSGVKEPQTNLGKMPDKIHKPDDGGLHTYPLIRSVDGANTSNEGTRLLSEFERYGGWRLVPEVLEVAKRHPKAKIVSHEAPLAIHLKGFLSSDETEHLVKLASTHMMRSKVVSSGKVGTEKGVSDTRTSSGAWLSGTWRDGVVLEIEKRIHDTVGVPKEFGEGIYVLRYETDQKYDPHTDNCGKQGQDAREACLKFLKRSKGPSCGDGFGGASCGDRIATFIVYLRTPEEGGETAFPKSEISRHNILEEKEKGIKRNRTERGWYCKDPAVFKVSPEPGDALFFWDYVPKPDISNHGTYARSGSHRDGSIDTEAINDPTALHAGCPVLKGEKWIATKWIRSSKFH